MCFRVGVLNVQHLRLVADQRTNKYCDEASWVNTKLYEVGCEQLADLTPWHHSVGYAACQLDPTWSEQFFVDGAVRHGRVRARQLNSIYPLHSKYHSFHGCGGMTTRTTTATRAHFVELSERAPRGRRPGSARSRSATRHGALPSTCVTCTSSS